MKTSKLEARLKTQRDQLCHLLCGGTLTKQAVNRSGLGEGVLIEKRHAEWRAQSAERKLTMAMEALDQIAALPRAARARRIAQSTATFIRELTKAANQ